MPDRPNVVFVICHDLGRHVSPYGRDVETPAVEAMAEAGVTFDNAVCTQPNCAPSRASIQTGLYPHQHGVMGLSHLGWRLNDDIEPLPARMARAGYDTHLFGFQHSVDWDHPERLGYGAVHNDVSDDVDTSIAAHAVVDRFEAALDDLPGEAPFYANLGWTEPHGAPDHSGFRHGHVDDAVFDLYDPETVTGFPWLDGADQPREDLADYCSLISGIVDPALQRVRDALRDHGLADDTVLIFTTDHGEPFARAKKTCYDSGVETALFAEGPGIPAGERRDAVVPNVDLFETVLDYAGADLPDDRDARSLRPLLDGDGTYDRREQTFLEHNWHCRPLPIRAARSDRYKYIRSFSPMPFDHDEPAEALYDLDADPHERRNVLNDPGTEEEAVAAELRSALVAWMEDTDDPLADGSIPMPTDDRDWLDEARTTAIR